MTLSAEDLESIRQIIREEIKATFGTPMVPSSSWAKRVQDARLHLEKLGQKDLDNKKLDKDIREKSKILPPHLRPRPEQYKSVHGKNHVIALLDDPSRWAEIPLLPVQWPSRKGKSGTPA